MMSLTFSSRVHRFIGAVALLLSLAPSGAAIQIKITDPTSHHSDYFITETDMEHPLPLHQDAWVDGMLNLTPTDGKTLIGFDAWNTRLPADKKWTLANGGTLNATLNVASFDAHSYHVDHVGGVEVNIEFIYNGADKDEFVWTQGLWLNYRPGDTAPGPTWDTMDDATLSNLTPTPNPQRGDFNVRPYAGGIFSPPAYPYQYTDGRFYDFPLAPYESGHFAGWAMLSKINYDTRTLTIYEGVVYSFDLHVENIPEPGTVGIGVLAFAVLRRRERPAEAEKAA